MMRDNESPDLVRLLYIAACVVIILWGVSTLSAMLGPLALGLMLAFAVVPFPKWLMHRFGMSKNRAVGITAVALTIAALVTVFAIEIGVARLAIRLPIYEQRVASLYQQTVLYMNAHGVDTTSWSPKSVLTAERLSATSELILPAMGTFIADGLLIFLLAFLLAAEMLVDHRVKASPLAEFLRHHGSHTRKYVALNAKTGSINAFANLVLLLAMGVDGAVLWTFLYFFLNFIPTLGFSLALIPPTLMALLMYGWKRALVVACGLILTNLIVDNVVMPIFAKHEMSISFLEITISLVVWAFLLGLPGAIIAIPGTLALKEFIEKNLVKRQIAMQEPSSAS